MDVINIDNECHFSLNESEICSDDQTLTILSTESPTTDSPFLSPIKKKEIVESIKSETNCESESCVYTTYLVKKKLGTHLADQVLKTRFKPKGPYNSDNWLDNFNIDDVLRQNMKKYKKFYAIPYQMIDFAEKKTELATINISDQLNHYDTMAVVVNTDVSSGKGKHWFAIFMDFRQSPYQLEFFNSSGNLPPYQIQTWLNKTKRDLERLGKKVDIIIVSPDEIQKSDTECGVFSLWFILSRLQNISVSKFRNINMGSSDEKMIEFRKGLFRHSH